MCGAYVSEYRGCYQPLPERHDDQRLLDRSKAASPLFLARTDSEDPDLVEAGPGPGVLYVRSMKARERQQRRQRLLDRARQGPLLGVGVVAGLSLQGIASPSVRLKCANLRPSRLFR